MLGDLDALWRQPDSLSVFLVVKRDRGDAVRALLTGTFPHDKVESLHFLRAFVFGKERQESERMVLNVVFDGTPLAMFGQLVARCPAWADVLGECESVPANTSALPAWLAERAVRPQLHYIGAVRTPLATLREEQALYEAIQVHLDANRTALVQMTPDEIRRNVRAFVRSRSDLPQGPRRASSAGAWVLEGLAATRVAVSLAAPALLVGLLLGLPLQWLALFVALGTFLLLGGARQLPRLMQRFEEDVRMEAKPEHTAMLLDDEDYGPMNQFTMLTDVRDTVWRRLNLRFTLFAGQFLVRHVWRWGKLVGVDTIHTARIYQIDGGRHMLFMSDFDGAWDRYLFDFLTTGAFAVVPIWTNSHGCPPEGHPEFAQRFLPFTRACQLRTNLWYSAMPDVTMSEIERNARIRKGLHGSGDAARWLELL